MEEDKIIDKEVPKEDLKDKTIYNYVDDNRGINTKSKIVYKNKDLFTTFPFYQDRKTNEIKQKYSFGKISFEGLKGKFPSGFIKNPKAGYGATSQLKPLMKFISKKFQIDEVLISKEDILSRVTKKIDYFQLINDLEYIDVEEEKGKPGNLLISGKHKK